MKFRVPTTGQVEKVYVVEAKDAEQAHARVRSFIDDPEMLGSGIVEEQESDTRYKTPEQVQKSEISQLPDGPQAVEQEAKTA